MALSVLGLVLSYAVLALLLLALLLGSLWRWWVKAGMILVTVAFLVISYFSLQGLTGWASTASTPSRFTLLSSRVVEPSSHRNDPGHIYIWIEELDANNIPSGTPRAFDIGYTDRKVRQVSEAQDKLDKGLQVEGKIASKPSGPAELRQDVQIGGAPKSGQGTSAVDSVPFSDDSSSFTFEDLPPPVLPDKGPL